MDYFKNFADSLPNLLSAEKQHNLLIEYYETHNEQTRQTLLEHNLRLCLKMATHFCNTYNCSNKKEELFSECVTTLSKSLDDYNPYNNNNCSFTTFAYNNMSYSLRRYLHNEDFRQSNMVDTKLHFSDGEESEDDLFFFLSNDAEDIAEQLANKEIVADAITYINNLNTKRSAILKMFLGIGCPRQSKQLAIANDLGVSHSHVSMVIKEELPKLKKYIVTKYPQSFPDAFKQIQQQESSRMSFKSTAERNQYVIDSFYGLNGKQQKSIDQILSEVGTTYANIHTILRQYTKSLTHDEKSKLTRSPMRDVAWYETNKYNIFNDYYGLNGSKIHSCTEIINKYGLSTPSYVMNILPTIEKCLVNEGKYTQEQINDIRQSRAGRKKLQTLNNYAPLYFEYMGTNGYEKSSRKQLSKKINVPLSTIDSHLLEFEKYLNSLNTSEREQITKTYCKQSQEME